MNYPTPHCEQARQWLAEAVDQELSSDDRHGLTAHLAECSACQTVAAWMPQVDTVVDADPGRAPDPAYFEALADRVLEQSAPVRSAARPWFLRWNALAPTALVVVAVGAITLDQLKTSKPVLAPVPAPEERVELADQLRSLGYVGGDAETKDEDAGLESAFGGVGTSDDVETNNEVAGPAETASILEKSQDAAGLETRTLARSKQTTPQAGEDRREAPEQVPPPVVEIEETPRDAARPQRFDLAEPNKLAEEDAAGRARVLRQNALAASEADVDATEPVLTLRDAFERAKSAESSQREYAVRTLFQFAHQQPVAERLQAQDSAAGKRAYASLSSEAEMTSTLADSVATFLSAQLPVLADPKLRRDIETWLRERE